MAALLFAALGSPPANAGPFDPETGRWQSTDAAIAYGFDGAPPAGMALRVFDPAGQRVDDAALAADQVAQTDALEGQGALRAGGDRRLIYVHLHGLADRLGDRRVEIQLWQRSLGARMRPFLVWYTGDREAALERLDTSNTHQMALMRLLPSGRRTSDGWVQYTSGPVDFSLGQRLAPTLLLMDRVESLHGNNQPDPDAQVHLDALEIHDLGPAAVPDARCSKVTEDTACGATGMCSMGRCVDHATLHGALFTTDRQRQQYLERRRFELDTYAGHAGLRAKLADFTRTLDGLAAAADKSFWPTLRGAWYGLADGHSSPPLAGYSPPPQLGICLVHGEADLLPGQPQVPLLFAKATFHPVVSQLEPGDALVSIDGLDPAAWRALVPHRLRYNGDPRNAAYVQTLQVMRSAALTGARLEFARCAGPEACDEASVERIVIDAAEAFSVLWDGEAPLWRGSAVPCDGRLSRAGTGQASYGNTFVGHSQADGVDVLMINATPAFFMPGFEAWFGRISAVLDPAPERLVLDQRIGNGGGFRAIDHLMGYLNVGGEMPPHFLMPWLGGREGTVEIFDDMLACARMFPSNVAFLWCGGSRYEQATDMHPRPGGAEDTRLAVLLGRDVSGNDFLTYHLAAREGPTRIFGPGPTYGAFGMIMSLGDLGVGIAGGSLQATDGAILWTSDSPLDARLSGPGVAPDEVVLQKQSDVLRGVDTLMEAAHAWLRQE